MKNETNREGGFVKIVLLIVIILLVMKYFHLTFSGILAHFNLSWPQIADWIKQGIDWIKNLFNSVK